MTFNGFCIKILISLSFYDNHFIIIGIKYDKFFDVWLKKYLKQYKVIPIFFVTFAS